MKKILLLSFLFVALIFNAQVYLYFGNKPFIKADLYMEDGSTKTGYLQDFQTPKIAETDLGFLQGIEKKLKFEVKDFKFKEQKTSTVQVIPIGDIKRIVLTDDNGNDKLTYDKMKLKTVNVKGELVDVNKTVVLPLEQEGKFNLYGINLAFIQNKRYVSALYLPYIKKPNDEYGIILIDINRINFFNLGKIDDKIKAGLLAVSNDCPIFQKDIDNQMKILEKEVVENRKEGIKKKNQARKDIKNKNQENLMAIKIDYDYVIKPYLNLMNRFYDKCPN